MEVWFESVQISKLNQPNFLNIFEEDWIVHTDLNFLSALALIHRSLVTVSQNSSAWIKMQM